MKVGRQPLCGSLSAYLFAVRSSGVAVPAVAVLDFVFLPVSPTLLQFFEQLAAVELWFVAVKLSSEAFLAVASFDDAQSFEWLVKLDSATGCHNLQV